MDYNNGNNYGQYGQGGNYGGYNPQQPDMPMKWFKFIIFFQLFASAVVNVINGIMAFTGAQYSVDGENLSELVYAFYPSLKAVDIIYGLLCLALAGCAIYVRQLLAKYKTDAPKMYLIFLAAQVVVGLVYVILLSVITGESLASVETYTSIITSVVLIIINKIYFDKRAHLFNN